jgi:hypothetical protein
MKIHIIGAGMAGLLAANMLRRHRVTVFEKQPILPNNHRATLRFRTPDVGNVLGIQFKKVQMLKTYVPYENVVADSLLYSRKVTGMYKSDRSIIEGTVTAERWIAPQDLIAQMSIGLHIEYEADFNFKRTKHPIISTIPMNHLMKILHYKNDIGFRQRSGYVATAKIDNCDAYISVLFPNPIISCSRATITGNQLIIEFPTTTKPLTHEIENILCYIGLYESKLYDLEIKAQSFFKIIDINETERHQFMKWATVHHNIYSLGRYACWRPKLLLDDLIKDIRTIEQWMLGGKK